MMPAWLREALISFVVVVVIGLIGLLVLSPLITWIHRRKR